MKKLILPAILLNCCFVTFAQKKQTFLVEYLSEQKRISSSLPDSVKERKLPTTVYTIHDGDTTNTETIEMNLGDLLGSSGISITFYMLSNKDMSKRFYTWGNDSNTPSGGNLSFNVNISVDTVFYDHKKWYSMTEGSIEEAEPDSYWAKMSFTRTSETKNILGHKCVKFVSSGKDKDKNISFWGSKDLPATLIPCTALKNFGCGVLQVDNPDLGTLLTATKITKL